MYELLVLVVVIIIIFVITRYEGFYSSGSGMRKMVDIDSSTMQGQDINDFNSTELQYYITHTP